MIARQAIAAAARAAVGIPWLHQGRNALGLDCAGVVEYVGMAANVPFTTRIKPTYARNAMPTGERLHALLEECGMRSVEHLREGAVVSMWWDKQAKRAEHLGIVVGTDADNLRLVHAYDPNEGVGRVSLDSFRAGGMLRSRVIACFDFPGVES